MKVPAVYIMASGVRRTLYVGVTAYLLHRVHQHREGLQPGFTERYAVKTLVYYELHADMPGAIAREKAIKEWRRAWKIELIEKFNPGWTDLFDGLV